MTSLIANPRVTLENTEIFDEHYWKESVEFSKMELFFFWLILLTFANTFMSANFSLKLSYFKARGLLRFKCFPVAFANEIKVLCISTKIYIHSWDLVIAFLLPSETQKTLLRVFSMEQE